MRKLLNLALVSAVLLCLAVAFDAVANGLTIYLPLLMRNWDSATPITTVTATTTPTATATPTVTATPMPTATATATPTLYPGVVMITLGDPSTVSGPGVVVSGSTVTIVDGGTYCVQGTLPDGMLAVESSGEVELILHGVTIHNATGPAARLASAGSLSLVLADGTNNVLSDGVTYSDPSNRGTLYGSNALEISGGGGLVVTANYKHGIVSDGALTIRNGHITIVDTVSDGFHAGSITVYGGSIDIVSTGSDGLESAGTLLVEDGVLSLAVGDDGLIGAGDVTINGGNIQIEPCVEGIESKQTLTINGGSISIAAADDPLNATVDITINGGHLYLWGGGDAIDTNGTLHVNGGVTVALGGYTPESGIDCDQGALLLNGGILVATGSDNSAPSEESAQRVVVLGGQEAGPVIHIVREDGAETLTFAVNKAYGSMVFTSPDLTPNAHYTVYSGGTVSGGSEFGGLYFGSTYSGGTVWVTFATDDVVTYVP